MVKPKVYYRDKDGKHRLRWIKYGDTIVYEFVNEGNDIILQLKGYDNRGSKGNHQECKTNSDVNISDNNIG